jgi:protein-L-isoaspartate(D-aspartate) O-methyltransferase
MSIDRARRAYAADIVTRAGVKSPFLEQAFGSVKRENFVGLGPWQLIRPGQFEAGYTTTPDSNARRLYENVLVALDPARNLNNGEPVTLARWLDALVLQPGGKFLHIGCGVGYYTAIAAEVVGTTGHVVAVEIEPNLADRARTGLKPQRFCRVLTSLPRDLDTASFDAILVNAGATEPLAQWIDLLSSSGRLLLPLTVGAPNQEVGVGHMLLISRANAGYAATFISPVGIFHCDGARSNDSEARLAEAYREQSLDEVQSLRRDEHPEDSSCWLHWKSLCLSRAAL